MMSHVVWRRLHSIFNPLDAAIVVVVVVAATVVAIAVQKKMNELEQHFFVCVITVQTYCMFCVLFLYIYNKQVTSAIG